MWRQALDMDVLLGILMMPFMKAMKFLSDYFGNVSLDPQVERAFALHMLLPRTCECCTTPPMRMLQQPASPASVPLTRRTQVWIDAIGNAYNHMCKENPGGFVITDMSFFAIMVSRRPQEPNRDRMSMSRKITCTCAHTRHM